MKDAGTENWSLLMEAASHEADTSSAYIYILSSALANTPEDSLSLPKVKDCKDKILEAISNPEFTGHYEALTALSETGNKNDLPLLSSLIDVNNKYRFSNKEDIAAAASYVILRIDRRQKYTLHGLDWIVITLYGIGMIMIGWYFSRKVKNTEDYLLGGRKMNSFTVGLSLFITMLSSLSFLSYPGEMIKNGPVVFVAMLIFPLIYYIVGWFLIPHFMEMRVSSAYELLEVRLGLRVRMLATFFFLTLRFFWMATIIYATINTALIAVIDIPQSYTTYIGILLMLVTILYTTIGGYKAVIATDAIQSIILWAGAILAVVFVMADFGSFTAWLPDHYLEHWAPFKWGVNLRERTTIGNTMIFLVTWYMCTNGSDQMAVQRYLSTKDIHAARRSFGISLIVTFWVKIFLALVGLAMIAYFTKNPHFLGYGQTLTDQADKLLPKFILIGLPVGISGLVVSGILAAAMSSLSSGLYSSSSVINEDILKRIMPGWVSGNPLKAVKKISFFVGIVAIFLSLLVGNVEGNLLDVVIKVVNLFVAPLFVLFFMAIFIPFATPNGTVAGGLISVAMAVAVAFWEFMGLKVFWIMPAAFVVGSIAGIIFSSLEMVFLKYSKK
jgi:SSS family solute:Na+ symporter